MRTRSRRFDARPGGGPPERSLGQLFLLLGDGEDSIIIMIAVCLTTTVKNNNGRAKREATAKAAKLDAPAAMEVEADVAAPSCLQNSAPRER